MRSQPFAAAGPHPRCPGCGYDLIASVRGRSGVCPECGRRFTRGELVPGARGWTYGHGLLGAAWALGVRSAGALPVWIFIACAIALGLPQPPIGGLLLILAATGLGLGFWLSRNLVDVAGRKSVALTVLAAAFAWGTVAAGVGVAAILKRVDGWVEVYALHTTAIFATFWIVRATVLSD